MINKAKEFSELDGELQGLFTKIEEMYEHYASLEYEKLLKTIFELEELVKAAKNSQKAAKTIDEDAKIGLIVQQANRGMENIVTDLSTNITNLCGFAHELRKVDTEDKHSNNLLYGQVRPDVLSKVILHNKFKDNDMI